MRRGAAGAQAGHRAQSAIQLLSPSHLHPRHGEAERARVPAVFGPRRNLEAGAAPRLGTPRRERTVPAPRARSPSPRPTRAQRHPPTVAVTPRDNGPERGLLTTSGSEGRRETPACDGEGRGVSRSRGPRPPTSPGGGSLPAGSPQRVRSHVAGGLVPQNTGSRQGRDGLTTATWPPPASGQRPAAAPSGERMLGPTASHDQGTRGGGVVYTQGRLLCPAKGRRYREVWRAAELSGGCGISQG